MSLVGALPQGLQPGRPLRGFHIPVGGLVGTGRGWGLEPQGLSWAGDELWLLGLDLLP